MMMTGKVGGGFDGLRCQDESRTRKRWSVQEYIRCVSVTNIGMVGVKLDDGDMEKASASQLRKRESMDKLAS